MSFHPEPVAAPALVLAAVTTLSCGAIENGPTPAAGGEKVDTPFYSLTLPGRWTEEPSGDPDRWLYVRNDEAATLTVSGMSDPRRRAGAELEETVREFAEMRRQVEREVSGDATEVEPLVVTREGRFVVARYRAGESYRLREAAALWWHAPVWFSASIWGPLVPHGKSSMPRVSRSSTRSSSNEACSFPDGGSFR